jgi:hypothetical protein
MSRAISPLVRAFSWLIALSILAGTPGCGVDWKKIGETFKSKKKKKVDDESDEDDKAVDLGTAAYPKGTTTPVKVFDWKAPKLDPSHYEITYILANETTRELNEAHRKYSDEVGYTSMGGGRFRWEPPPNCPKDMGCVYGRIVDDNKQALQSLIGRFKKYRDKEELDAKEIAQLVVTMVQDIEYEIPEDQPFGVRPPAVIVLTKKGDCDSKSLLGQMILSGLGIDSMLVSSRAHKHAMLGIALPASGTKFEHNGRKYAFTEMTARASPIGHINPELLMPNDWQPVPLISTKK